jgi:hypothetical protein
MSKNGMAKSTKQIGMFLVLVISLGVFFMQGGIYDRFIAPAPATQGIGPQGPIPGVDETCELSAKPTVNLDIRTEGAGVSASAADTVWKLSTDGINWVVKETDSNSATPSLDITTKTYWKALVYDDATLVGKEVQGYVGCVGSTGAVRLWTIDTAPTVKIFRAYDNTISSAANNDTMVGNTTYHQSIQVYSATNKVYNAPAICFDYAVSNYTRVSLSGNYAQAVIPNFLAGTVDACYSIPTIDTTGYTVRTDVETASTTPTGNIVVYLVDTQNYMDKNEVFTTGFNLKDTPYTNVGDSTDTAAVGTIYGSG